MSKQSRVIFWLLILLFVLGGAALLFVFIPRYELSRVWLDHLAQDGSLDMYAPAVYQELRFLALLAGVLLLVFSGVSLFRKRRVVQWIEQSFLLPGQLYRRLRRDSQELRAAVRDCEMHRTEMILLAGLLLLAITVRAAFIMHPLEHDEAYTVVTFASNVLKEALSDYHHPNNHLFHTFLVHFSIRLLGLQPWAVRLPAFLAGVLLVPAVYFLTRQLYNRQVAALAGMITAGMPALVSFSTNARGYTLIMLFTVLVFMAAGYIRRHKRLLGWGLFVIFSVLGLYTIPIFVFSYAGVLTWFFLTIWIKQEDEAYQSPWEILHWLFFSGVAAFMLTLILYSPVIIRYSGFSILSQDVSVAFTWPDFMDQLFSRAQDNWSQWLIDLPQMAGYLVLVGAGLAMVLPFLRKGPLAQVKAAGLLPYAVIASTAALAIAMRPNLYPRFMSYSIPLLIIWASAGWSALLTGLLKIFRLRESFTWAVLGLVLAVVIAGSGWRIVASPMAGFNRPGGTELLANYLEGELRETDLVVVSPPYDAILWYYSRLHGIDMRHYKRELPFFRAFVVVDPTYNETIESVLIERGPELFFFDLSQTRLVFQSGTLVLYECTPYEDLIRKEYGVP